MSRKTKKPNVADIAHTGFAVASNPIAVDRMARLVRKARNRARYQRRYMRHAPPAPSIRYPAELRLTRAQRAAIAIHGIPEHLQQFVRMAFGEKGKWGHGRYVNATSKGPGRRRVPPEQQDRPAGTKLVKRFIRDARGENVEYRKIYAALTGEQYHERYAR